MESEKKPNENWTRKIKDWTAIEVVEYQFIFEQAEKRFEDVISENESITNKAIKIATAIMVMTGFCIGLLSGDFSHNYQKLFYATALLVLINLVLIILIMLPKKSYNRGLLPSVSTNDEFDNSDDKGHYLKKLYYNSIGVLEDNIVGQIENNANRISLYRIIIIAFALLLLFTSISVALFILNRP